MLFAPNMNLKEKIKNMIHSISGPNLPFLVAISKRREIRLNHKWTKFWQAHGDVYAKRWMRDYSASRKDNDKYEKMFIQSLKNLSDASLQLMDEIKYE